MPRARNGPRSGPSPKRSRLGGGALRRKAREPGIGPSILDSFPTPEFSVKPERTCLTLHFEKGQLGLPFMNRHFFKLEGPFKKMWLPQGGTNGQTSKIIAPFIGLIKPIRLNPKGKTWLISQPPSRFFKRENLF